MGEGGGEDEGCAFDGQNEMGVEEAGNVGGVDGAQRRGDGGGDGGQGDDDDGFWVVEGGRGVEAKVEAFLLGGGDGGDVLVFRGVESVEEAGEVDDGADVGGVVAGAGELGVGGLVDEVGAGAVGKSGDDGFGVAVVEQGLVAGLGEAGVLLSKLPLETLRIRTQVEGAGEEIGVFLEGLGVAGRNELHGGDVFFGAGLFKAGFGEVLGGADEDAGAAFDGGAEGAEVAAGFGGEEEQGLLSVGRNGDEDTFFADLFLPSLDAGEPGVGRWVGGAAEEADDEEVVDGLGGRAGRGGARAGRRAGDLGRRRWAG